MIKKHEKYLEKLGGYLENFFTSQQPYIFCKEGCSLCCETGEYPFSKTEFDYAMIGYQFLDNETKKVVDANVKEIKNAKKEAQNKTGEQKFMHQCPFLIDKKCSIYKHRGIICRSYGLLHFTVDDEGNKSHKKPFCSELGLNYSNVLDEETGKISSKKWKALGIEIEPLGFNIGLDVLNNNDITKELGLELGEQRALIDWFEG